MAQRLRLPTARLSLQAEPLEEGEQILGSELLRADVQGRLRAPAGGSADTDRGSPCRS